MAPDINPYFSWGKFFKWLRLTKLKIQCWYKGHLSGLQSLLAPAAGSIKQLILSKIIKDYLIFICKPSSSISSFALYGIVIYNIPFLTVDSAFETSISLLSYANLLFIE